MTKTGKNPLIGFQELMEKVRNRRRKKKMQQVEEGEAEEKLVTVASNT